MAAVERRNQDAIARAGSLAAAYGDDPSRIVPGRGIWAGKWWVLKGAICDGPYDRRSEAVRLVALDEPDQHAFCIGDFLP
ncbi:hypothetical protein [Novosphingobium sp. EMRT-2]|uniref:hypothetical protein n=1 Tax=Novosphingobium sp. EMRT-2 TaxID=2571749 RepID=UPI0010BD7751|nr:hypothetical protein [Novosphingobium sp. EMRT-2]QCI93386.1 hypothetical protein FA702_07340 [Novosphingobium sp. EMRT-2]